LKLAGQPIAGRDALWLQMAAMEAGQETEIQLRHEHRKRTVKITLDRLPEGLPPAELPPAHPPLKPGGAKADAAKPVKVGVVPLAAAEFKNEVWGYVPEAYDPAVPYGLLVWLHGQAAVSRKELLARWKPLCDRYDLVLVVPRSGDPAGWKMEEEALVTALIQQVRTSYHVDGARVVVCGQESGGTLASLLAFRDRDFFSAAVVINAAAMGQPPENDPLHRLAVYVAAAEKSPHSEATTRLVAQLRANRIPVTLKGLGPQPRELTGDELAELVRWIDMLDRI